MKSIVLLFSSGILLGSITLTQNDERATISDMSPNISDAPTGKNVFQFSFVC